MLRRPESFPPRFVSFAWQYRECRRWFAPTGCGRSLLWAWTFGHPEPNRDSFAEISGFSQVPGRTPSCTCPGRIPRGTLHARPSSAQRMLPSAHPTTSAPLFSLSRLVTTACTLAVYASWRGPLPSATQDSLPVGGQPLPGRIRTYQVHYEGFPFLSIAFSFLPSLAYPGARGVSSKGRS